MKRIVIFDFNRTLYDPEGGKLLPQAKWVLRVLRRRSFALLLFSRAEKRRETLFKSLGLKPYFTKILTSRRKGLTDFKRLLPKKFEATASFVVGDRVKSEIALGNQLGLKTIWVRQGKFAKEKPANKKEQPRLVVKNLRALLKIIR